LPRRRDQSPSLEDELQRIRLELGLADELEVVWTPDAAKSVAGEVKGRTIHIYDSTLEAAGKTLKHEVVDYLVAKAIGPYRDLANALIGMINDCAYERKEGIVEMLSRLV
jgi:hypothetical protein